MTLFIKDIKVRQFRKQIVKPKDSPKTRTKTCHILVKTNSFEFRISENIIK